MKATFTTKRNSKACDAGHRRKTLFQGTGFVCRFTKPGADAPFQTSIGLGPVTLEISPYEAEILVARLQAELADLAARTGQETFSQH